MRFSYIVVAPFKGELFCIKRNNKTIFFNSYEEAQKYIDESNYNSSTHLDLKIVEISQ